MNHILSKTGIYIAYPTSHVLELTYRNSKTRVNNRHTNVGRTGASFAARKKDYYSTFDNEVCFTPVAIIQKEALIEAEKCVLARIRSEFKILNLQENGLILMIAKE